MSEVKPFSKIIGLLYPNKCISCGEIIAEGKYLCENCKKDVEEIPHKDRCPKCGLVKPKCDCRQHEYYFEGAVCWSYNAGTGRKIVYRYKFSGKPHYAKYISSQMVRKLKEEMPDTKFHIVTNVPTTFKNKRKRGFDQAYLLAKEVAKQLRLPITKNVIGVKPFSKTQHKVERTDRFDNADSKYFVKGEIKGRRVLLVDDIKTTGATLSACAKQLLLSGALEVYCLTALAGAKEKSQKNNSF